MRRFLWLLLLHLLFLGSALPRSSLVDAATRFKSRRNSTSVLTPQASIGVPRRLPFPRRRSTTEAPTNATTVDDRQKDDGAPSVVWPQRKRPRRLRLPTPTTPEPQVLLKLLQPRPTRPAIYSLDGFVPTPSLRPSTMEPPIQLHFRRTDLQLLSSAPRRKKVSREEEDDGLELQRVGVRKKRPVSRYTAFARKGVPGEDFPVLTHIPPTDFDCGPQPGLYADPYTDCQVWHMCPGGNLSPRHSFLCPNGTIFNQKKRICDWWYNVDCRRT
ncbi:chitin-binding type-2 domain-containing protein [Caerostris darwini]|uniref:Chitin-binding type-2 domain-containing protein n=1 Tax=Caerostris darwini TaxID=1538125 RepID=A0AAV4RKK7_9ARAC|nr:chitin-binding type-2 domain-containing protein [Caerostris darwini]